MELLSFCLESKSKPEIDIQNTGTNIDKGDQTKGPLALNWISSTRLSRNTCSCLKLFRAEQDVNIYPPSIIPDNEQPSLDFEISTYLQWRRSWEADKALITARHPEAASRTQAYHDNVESLFLYVRPHAHQYIVQMESNVRDHHYPRCHCSPCPISTDQVCRHDDRVSVQSSTDASNDFSGDPSSSSANTSPNIITQSLQRSASLKTFQTRLCVLITTIIIFITIIIVH